MPTGCGIGCGIGRDSYGLVSDPGGLPSGAIAFADFKNGTYYYGGNALEDFLVEDPTWGTFDPVTDVVPGFGIGESLPTIAAGLESALLASGFIVVATMGSIPSAPTAATFSTSLIQGDFDAWTELSIFRDNANDSHIRNDLGIHSISQFLVDGANKVAMEFTSALAAVSTNGSAVDDETGSGAAFDFIGLNFGGSGEDGWLESLVFYPSGHAALNTLSAL